MLYLLLLCLFYFDGYVTGKLTNIPRDQTVSTGEQIRLSCSTDVIGSGIQWKHTYIGGVNPYNVYTDGKIINGYLETGRYWVDTGNSGKYDLIINDAQVDDAGDYLCIDNSGAGQIAKAFLTVNVNLENLTVVPVNTIVLSGQEARLSCSSSYRKNVWWKRIPYGSTVEVDIYYGDNGFLNGYKLHGRHRIDTDVNTGRYDLIISNVRSDDAGKYVCIDQSGIGYRAMAELTVLDSCSSRVQPDNIIEDNLRFCGIEPDQLSMTCSTHFTGNYLPDLEWRSSKNGETINSDITKIYNKSSLVVTLTTRASSATNWEDYVCQTKVGGASSTCRSTSKIKLIKLSDSHKIQKISKTETVTCSAGTNQQCSYSWIHTNDDGERVIEHSAVINLTQIGLYKCKAECSIRGNHCEVYPLTVDFNYTAIVDSDETVSPESGNYRALMITIIVVCIVIGLALVIFIVVWKKTRMCLTTAISKIPTKRQELGDQVISYKLNNNATYGMKSLAMSQKYLYAIFASCNQICVFRGQPPYNKTGANILVPGMETPEDIVAATSGNTDYLYISDSAKRCIWKVSVYFGYFGNSTIVSKFADVDCTYKLSVTPNGNVLLVKEKKPDIPNSLEVYNDSGKWIKTIALKSNTESLQHAVFKTKDSFVVSFEERIGEVDKLGNILKCYPPINSPGKRTDEPRHISLYNGFTFLTDFANSKILVLNKDLEQDDAITVPDVNEENDEYLQMYTINKNCLLLGLKSGKIMSFDISKIKEEPESYDTREKLQSELEEQKRQTALLQQQIDGLKNNNEMEILRNELEEQKRFSENLQQQMNKMMNNNNTDTVKVVVEEEAERLLN